MREPLSDDEVQRIARETARQIVKRTADLVLIVAVSVIAAMLFPALIVFTVNSFAPPLGQSANPLMGMLFAFAFVVLAVITVRSWASLRHR